MAKFRYRMQSILDIKLKLETQAKQDFAAAKAELDLEIEKLEVLKQRKNDYVSIAQNLLSGDLVVQDILDNKSAILKMDDYISEQKINIKKAEERLEKVREKLQQVMQERKMHEKLKEKAMADFLDEEKHSEGKEVDELTSYTYGQRQKESSLEAEEKGEDLNG